MALFQEYTEDALLDEALNNAPNDIDTRQGSVFFDAIAAVVSIMARLFSEANILSEQSSVITATGENLDILANNLYLNKLTREQAITAQYNVDIICESGVDIGSLDLEEDDRFFDEDNGLYFLLKMNRDDNENIVSYYVEAETPGAEYNDLISGTNLVPVETVDLLSSITIGSVVRKGVDEETDEEFRKRIQELLSAPSENANVQQYKTWCEQVEGVGSATIYPLFAGPNTVKAVLTDSNNRPCDASIVKKVQDYIDPITTNTKVLLDGKEVTIGDGLGGGVAPLGAHFLAVSANEDKLNLTIVGIIISDGVDEDTIKLNISKAIDSYFDILVDNYNATEEITVKLIDIISEIANIPGIEDFSQIKINNVSANHTVLSGYIPSIDVDHITFEEVIA